MTAQKTNCLLRLKVTPKENSDAFVTPENMQIYNNLMQAKGLRQIILAKYKLHQNADLFDKAYEYLVEYY